MAKKHQHVDATIEETYACHEMFRRMGIPADNIFLEMFADGVAVTAKQAARSFRVVIGKYAETSDKFVEEWKHFVDNMPEDAVLERIWADSTFSKNSVEMVTHLVSQGFVTKKPKTVKRAPAPKHYVH